MWLFTEEGFYSAVVGKDDPDQIVVRARAREDLVRLIDVYSEWTDMGDPVILDEGGDYPHRIVLHREVWAEVVQGAAMGISYTNFKDRVHDVLGHERAHTYLRVWSALLELEAKHCSECGTMLYESEIEICTPCIRKIEIRAAATTARAKKLKKKLKKA
jgi:hypothetical protein